MSVYVDNGLPSWGMGGSLLYTIIVLVALYMSFRRNNGFNLWSFLFAFFFAPIYIVYALATGYNGTAVTF